MDSRAHSRPSPPTEGATGTLRVATVSADAQTRARIAAALARAGLAIVAEAEREEELLGEARNEAVDAIVVADGRFAETDRFRALRKALPETRLVAVARLSDQRAIRNAMREGVDGVVLEERLDHVLALAVQAVCAGQLILPRELGLGFAKPLLTSREKQILGMVVLGFTNGEIARRLYVAETTIKSHLSSAFAKLGVRSRKEATALILDPEGGLGTGILAISEDDGTPAAPATW